MKERNNVNTERSKYVKIEPMHTRNKTQSRNHGIKEHKGQERPKLKNVRSYRQTKRSESAITKETAKENQRKAQLIHQEDESFCLLLVSAKPYGSPAGRISNSVSCGRNGTVNYHPLLS